MERAEGSRQGLSRVQPWDPAICWAHAAAAALAPISTGCGALPQPGRRAATGDPDGPMEVCELPAPLPPLPATPGPFPRPPPLTAAPGYSRCTRGPSRGRAAPARPARPVPQGPYCGQHVRAGRGCCGQGQNGKAGTAKPVQPLRYYRESPLWARRVQPRAAAGGPAPPLGPAPSAEHPLPRGLKGARQGPPPAAHWFRGLNEAKLIGRSAERRALIG